MTDRAALRVGGDDGDLAEVPHGAPEGRQAGCTDSVVVRQKKAHRREGYFFLRALFPGPPAFFAAPVWTNFSTLSRATVSGNCFGGVFMK